MNASESRGRMKFLLIAGLTLLPELAVTDLSVAGVVRALLTSALLFATWVGHGWARALLMLSAFGAVLLCAFLGVYLEHSASPLRLALLVVAIVSYAVVGMTLLFSRDVQAYLELEKLPAGPSRGDER